MRILLVEDDFELSKNLIYYLKKEGYEIDSCDNGEDALLYCKQNIHDLILLDRMLPKCSGTEVLNTIRSRGNRTPVLFLTALGTLSDKVAGLNLGADDYLVKPFAMEELSARIRSLLRRSIPSLPLSSRNIQWLDLTFQPQVGELTGPAGTITLSKRESTLLELFLCNPGQTLSRGQLLNKVWGPEGDVEDGNLDNYIFFLRRRFKSLESDATLTTLRGIGYRLEAKED